MTEHLIDPYAEVPPTPADGLTSAEAASPSQGTKERRTVVGRRPPNRKRESRPEAAMLAKVRREREEMASLQAQGFTAAEAARLLRVADPNQAVMRRLRFQRWLLDHGLLDEFSA